MQKSIVWVRRESVLAKAEKTLAKFRAEVEKEKDKIRRVAMAEVKAEEVPKAVEAEKVEAVSPATPDETAPPYLELNLRT